MKFILPIVFIYTIIISFFAITFANDTVIAVLTLIFYFLFSSTYFRQTFIPFCLGWFGEVINDHYFMEKLKNDEKMKPYVSTIGSLYVSYQANRDSVESVVKKLSLISFLILPILFTVHYKLNKITKK